MARILRGDIIWADLNPVQGHEQGGRRPILVISHRILNEKSGTVIGLALTSQEPSVSPPLAYKIASCILPKASWVKTNQVRTLSTQRLGERLGRVSAGELQLILDGFKQLFE